MKRQAWIGLVCLCSLILPVTTPSQTTKQSASTEQGADVVACGLTLRANLVIVEVEEVTR